MTMEPQPKMKMYLLLKKIWWYENCHSTEGCKCIVHLISTPQITTSFRQLSSTRFVHFKKCCGRWPPRCLKLGLQKISLHLGFLSQNTLRKKCCDGSVSRTVGGHVSVWPIIFYIMIQAHRILMGYSWEEWYIFTYVFYHKNQPFTGWWFQPIWKILVKLEIFHK